MKRLALLMIFALAACSPKPGTPDPSSTDGGASSQAEASDMGSASPVIVKAVPAAFVGLWDGSLADCKTGSILKLTVTPKALDFWESTAYLNQVTVLSDQEVVVDGAMSGEGEEWHADLRLVLSQDGQTLSVTNGSTTTPRVKCPAVAAVASS